MCIVKIILTDAVGLEEAMTVVPSENDPDVIEI